MAEIAVPVADAVKASPVSKSGRIASIDLVRGLAMVFMALDHTRDYVCNIQFSPEEIDKTWMFYFLVRWVTHYCAPAFFLLAGVGAYLYGRRHSPVALQGFLLTRGVWLVVLEFTVIGFAWTFLPWGMFGVIACLGFAMILLAPLARLPRWLILALALVAIGGHDLFDGLKPAAFHAGQWLLFLLHHRGRMQVGSLNIFVLFPLIPWCAVTLLGYAIGPLFEGDAARSRRTLIWAGVGAIVLFAVLRATNLYGNPPAGIAASTPGEWHVEPTLEKSAILFLDVEKYPPSLDYLCMTLGPIFLLLAIGGSRLWGWFGRVMQMYGRVPLFYYILHIFAIHLAAAALGAVLHQPVAWLFHGGFMLSYQPGGEPYGQGLAGVCAVWLAIVGLLYWPCAWFARVKNAHPKSLLRFL